MCLICLDYSIYTGWITSNSVKGSDSLIVLGLWNSVKISRGIVIRKVDESVGLLLKVNTGQEWRGGVYSTKEPKRTADQKPENLSFGPASSICIAFFELHFPHL